MSLNLQSGTKKQVVVLRVVTSYIMDQLKKFGQKAHRISRNIHVTFATYLQNVTTLSCKITNNVRAHLSFANHGVKHSDTHMHRVVIYIKQLTDKIRLSGN